MSDVERLKATVIDGGYCVGCGGCAAVADAPIRMQMDGFGRLQAVVTADAALSQSIVTAICPFSGSGPNESEMGAELFSEPGATWDDRLGWSRAVWAGYVSEGDFRDHGSSGGMGNWMAAELLRLGAVDAVVHVKPGADGRLFGYSISRTLEELRPGAKSRYYPIEMSAVLQHVRENPGHYALVGVPCFVKAARLQARQDPIIRERLRFTIALVCGHLKSDRFAGMFAWQMGIHPDRLSSFDFRVKNENGRANQYSVRAVGRDEHGAVLDVTRQNKDLFGYLWGHGFLKYRACDYCDDVMGETADLTVGDAWLPAFVDDPRGTNVVIARNREIERIVRQAIAQGRLSLSPITIDDAAASQEAGLRHRRAGLSVRLAHAARKGRWAPPKRRWPTSGKLTNRQRWVYLLRAKMSERSHGAFQEALEGNTFDLFVRRMTPYVVLHDWLNRNRNLRASARKLLRAMRLPWMSRLRSQG